MRRGCVSRLIRKENNLLGKLSDGYNEVHNIADIKEADFRKKKKKKKKKKPLVSTVYFYLPHYFPLRLNGGFRKKSHGCTPLLSPCSGDRRI
jgi:hypothetical protein